MDAGDSIFILQDRKAIIWGSFGNAFIIDKICEKISMKNCCGSGNYGWKWHVST